MTSLKFASMILALLMSRTPEQKCVGYPMTHFGLPEDSFLAVVDGESLHTFPSPTEYGAFVDDLDVTYSELACWDPDEAEFAGAGARVFRVVTRDASPAIHELAWTVLEGQRRTYSESGVYWTELPEETRSQLRNLDAFFESSGTEWTLELRSDFFECQVTESTSKTTALRLMSDVLFGDPAECRWIVGPQEQVMRDQFSTLRGGDS